MHKLTNLFHTMRTKLGIKDSERHLVLKYRDYLHKHIQEEMEFAWHYISLCHQDPEGGSRGSRGGGAPLPVTDVGEGFSVAVSRR